MSGEPLAQTSLVVVRDAADSSPLMTSLPNNLSQLINLVSLNLSGHNLSKIDIPLGQLTLLRTLTLSRNQLRSFGNGTGVTVLMPLLQELDLSNNALAVMPFGATVRATALRSLNCSQNQIRKFVVDHVRAMPSLTSLCLLNNGITGLPAEIGELTNLVELQLAHNRLSALPDSLSNLQDLSTLELSNNLLRALPSSLSALPALWRSTEEWSLGVNALSESPLYELRTMEHLRVIDLHDNSIALWPESFAALTSEPTRLGALALVSSFLSGRSSSTAGAIAPPTPTATTTADIVNATTPAAAATRAFVASSSLTPTGTPTKLGAVVPASSTTAPVPPTTAVVAAVAPVSDVVSPPRPFGAPRAKSSGSHLVPPQLSELILRNNRLSSINACVDDMQQYVHLKRLDLSHNAFKSVPQELVLLTALEHLDLSDCASLLVLPADLSGFKRLSTLLLARCGKLAELPVSLASLPALQAFSFSHLSAAAPRALGVAVNAAAADADDVEKAEDDGGYVPSRHCVGAICDADAMRARFQYNISLRVLGGAPHPLAGAMLLALAAADGKRFLHNDGIKHMRSFVARPDACAAESEPFRVVAADFVGRTMSLLARDEQFRDRLVQDDSLSLLLLLAENKHHGVVSECAVALTSLCGFVHEPQLVADARATVDQAIDPASVAATSPAATAAAVAPVKEAAASTPTATPHTGTDCAERARFGAGGGESCAGDMGAAHCERDAGEPCRQCARCAGRDDGALLSLATRQGVRVGRQVARGAGVVSLSRQRWPIAGAPHRLISGAADAEQLRVLEPPPAGERRLSAV